MNYQSHQVSVGSNQNHFYMSTASAPSFVNSTASDLSMVPPQFKYLFENGGIFDLSAPLPPKPTVASTQFTDLHHSLILEALEKKQNKVTLTVNGKKKKVVIRGYVLNTESIFGFDFQVNNGINQPYILLSDAGNAFLFEKALDLVTQYPFILQSPNCTRFLVCALNRKFCVPQISERLNHVSSNGTAFLYRHVHDNFVAQKDFHSYQSQVDASIADLHGDFGRLNRMVGNNSNEVAGYRRQLEDALRRISQLENQLAPVQPAFVAMQLQLEEQQNQVRRIRKRNMEYFLHVHSVTTHFNDLLRELPMHQWNDALREHVIFMDGIFDLLPEYTGITYRGINLEKMERRSPGWLSKVVQNGYVDKAYTCTSRNPNEALPFALDDDNNGTPVIMEIQQKSGRYISPYVADEYKHEEEVLLPRDTRLRCIGSMNRVFTLPNNGGTRQGYLLQMVEI
jgi:ADP-ribosyltransferase exoenzyme